MTGEDEEEEDYEYMIIQDDPRGDDDDGWAPCVDLTRDELRVQRCARPAGSSLAPTRTRSTH
mgnify:CR=1 FL=1